MNHIKTFKNFESVIIPTEMDNKIDIKSIEDLKEYGRLNGFDVANYEEFYDSLSEDDKKTAPKKRGPSPFFALFHPINKKPMFVIIDPWSIRMPHFSEILDDIISHERVHGEQNLRRKGLTFSLPDPNKQKEYFSDRDEIMAFSWTIAKDLARSTESFDDAIKMLDGKVNRFGPPKQFAMLWEDIKRVCDKTTLNKYRKNIYNYLRELFNKNKQPNGTETLQEKRKFN